MCGIAGVLSIGARAANEVLVREMCDLMEHRGPDDEGFYASDDVVLGMRRLSIIDVAGGQQPVSNENHSVWAVFNGEIYNFRELRDRLRAAGHTFNSRSDSETIVHAYEEFGLDFPRHLQGMFAIALWDAQRNRLILVRDRFGKKPLFYAAVHDGLVFGSELKCLLHHPQVSRAVDPVALDLYLQVGYVPAPRSILGGVSKLRPAHMLVMEGADRREQAYWKLEPRTARGDLTEPQLTEAAEELEGLLTAAVRRRLVADVPLGAFLSAGLDSSLVVALMARLTGEPVHTFTIGLDEPGMNEAPMAERTAEMLKTHHRTLVVRPDLEDVLGPIVWGMDEPQADSSCVPTYYVSRLAREHVAVCLTGDGGDEIFAGYPRYHFAAREMWFDTLPREVRRTAGALGTLIPAGVRGRGLLTRAALPWQERYSRGMTIFDQRLRHDLYQAAWRSKMPSETAGPYVSLLAGKSSADLISALQWADIHSYMADDILAKVDRMSMVNSLETRCPLLDHEVVEFAFGLPSSAFYADGLGKRLLRQVAKRLLPAELLARPKSGFGIPVADWLRGPLRTTLHDVLLGERLASRGWFNRSTLTRLLREHDRGWIDHGQRLWSLLFLELWAEQFLDRPLHAPASLGPARG
jgi:asparagine synthase (glutamine-hydrolysing)